MLTAAMQPTELSILVQDCVERALADCGLLLKSAAADMEVSFQMLSDGLRGEKHLSLQRLSLLGRPFLVAFCKRVMAQLGGVALDADERALLIGAATMGRKPMVRMTTVTLPLRRQA